MKKWIAVVIIILILIINPSKSSTFNKDKTDEKNTKIINSIALSEDNEYIKYQDYIILGQGRELASIDSNGEIKTLLSLSKTAENFDIHSGNYIDILDTKDDIVTSINSSGKTIFTDKIYQETIMYKSIDKNSFISVYKKDNKQYIRIQDIEEKIIKEIEYNSKITHLESFNNKLIVIDLNTDKGIYSKLAIYDKNGEIIKSHEFDEIVIDAICENENIYLLFNNEIKILDKNLDEKESLDVKGIEKIEKSTNGQSYIIDNEKKIISFNKDEYKRIKSKSEVVAIEEFGQEYITYSDYQIFGKNNKEILTLNEAIKDVVYIADGVVGVDVGKEIKIIKLQ